MDIKAIVAGALAIFIGMSATGIVFRITASEPAPVCAEAPKR